MKIQIGQIWKESEFNTTIKIQKIENNIIKYSFLNDHIDPTDLFTISLENILKIISNYKLINKMVWI